MNPGTQKEEEVYRIGNKRETINGSRIIVKIWRTMSTSKKTYEEEDWEKVHGPDCDGARSMVERGRRQYLEKMYKESPDIPEYGKKE